MLPTVLDRRKNQKLRGENPKGTWGTLFFYVRVHSCGRDGWSATMGGFFGFECSLLTLHMRQLVYIHHDIMKLANESHTPLTS